MIEITFLVRGSASEPYEVMFKKDGDKIIASCTCPAGAFGQICKHRLRIMSGDSSGITSENLFAVADVQTWVSTTYIGKMLLELQQAERQFEDAKKHVALCKKRLARFLGVMEKEASNI